ncbi:MAG: hypothetical protein AAGI11_17265 [Pseudomonadota bacterium]
MKLTSLRERYSVNADPLRTERRVELALLIFVLLLVLQLLWMGVRLALGGLPAPKAPSTEALAAVAAAERGVLAEGGSSEIIARPLFWQSRRPLVASVAPSAEEKAAARQTKLKNVSLLGVFGGGSSGGVIALVKDKQRRIIIGEAANGWELIEISPNGASFVNAGLRETLPLEIRGGGAVALADDDNAAREERGATATKGKKKQKQKAGTEQSTGRSLIPPQFGSGNLLQGNPPAKNGG